MNWWRAEDLITQTLKLEESRFRTTLERGLGLLEEASRDLGEGDELAGQTAFKLYDTYGFPLDLTQDALRRRGISVEQAGFTHAMERQKSEARASWPVRVTVEMKLCGIRSASAKDQRNS